jgi:hypothetical protein
MEKGSMVRNNRPETLFKRGLKGLGYLFLSQFLTFFINISFTAMLSKFLPFLIFSCICTLCITLGLMFNWSYNCAKTDEALDRQGTKPYDKYMPAKMGVIVGVIPLVLYIILIISKIGLIGNFLPVYTILSNWQLPFRVVFSASIDIADITAAGLIGFGFLTLLIPAAAVVTYVLVKRGVDFSKYIYEKKK